MLFWSPESFAGVFRLRLCGLEGRLSTTEMSCCATHCQEFNDAALLEHQFLRNFIPTGVTTSAGSAVTGPSNVGVWVSIHPDFLATSCKRCTTSSQICKQRGTPPGHCRRFAWTPLFSGSNWVSHRVVHTLKVCSLFHPPRPHTLSQKLLLSHQSCVAAWPWNTNRCCRS